MKNIKVLIIESNVFIRKFLSDAVNNTKVAEVSHASPNGELALMWLKQNSVEIILLSVEINNKYCFDILKIIQERYKIKVIIINNSNEDSFKVAYDTLNSGALDFVDIHTMKLDESNLKNVSGKLRAVLIAHVGYQDEEKMLIKQHIENNYFKKELWSGADIVLIASSTGGPVALEKVFSLLPKTFSKPVLIIQHMPPGFTEGLAKSLDRKSNLNVVEAFENQDINEGKAVVAAGGFHMTVYKNNLGIRKIKLTDTEYVNGVKPSADVLFKSIATEYEGKNVLVVVLTGMGRDGADGILQLKKKCNCFCITQSLSSSVAYGMPKAVQDIGLSDKEVDIGMIANDIYRISYGI